jgi:hypothetical protein
VAYHSPMTDAIADNDAWALTVDSSGDGRVLLAANQPWQVREREKIERRNKIVSIFFSPFFSQHSTTERDRGRRRFPFHLLRWRRLDIDGRRRDLHRGQPPVQVILHRHHRPFDVRGRPDDGRHRAGAHGHLRRRLQ